MEAALWGIAGAICILALAVAGVSAEMQKARHERHTER